MKGFSNQSGVELRIEVLGERWAQGDRIQVNLECKSKNTLYLALASGLEKKVKARAPDAFHLLQENRTLGQTLSCQFTLDPDCRITDKSGSLYILYGVGDPPTHPASLRLQIEPHVHSKDFIEVLTQSFRFSQKSFSMTKTNEVEFKLGPPGSKEWASLEGLSVFLKMNHEVLHCRFHFQRKEINALKSTLTAEKVSKTFQQNFPLKDLVHEFNQRLNRDAVFALFESVTSEYRSQSSLFS